MAGGILVHPGPLKEFCRQVLERVGLNPGDATLVADSLVAANLRGVDTHGVVRLPFYVNKLKRGGTKVQPDIRVVQEGISSALIDADHGMGQVAGARAMRLAISKAKETGVALIGVYNSEHFGAAAYYSMMAAAEDMIGITWSNGPPVMAPWGGRAPTIGNAPLSIAAPTKGEPMVLDMAMSVVSAGKVRLAAKKGEKIPKGWVINKYGRATDDPNDLPDGGALLPLGYKGYGLAVMGEVLTSVLTGAGMLGEVCNWLFNPEKATRTGHVFMAIDIAHFIAVDRFKERIEKMADELRSSPKAEGVERIYLPGEIESEEAAVRRNGFLVPAAVYEDLVKLATEYGVDISLLKSEVSTDCDFVTPKHVHLD